MEEVRLLVRQTLASLDRRLWLLVFVELGVVEVVVDLY